LKLILKFEGPSLQSNTASSYFRVWPIKTPVSPNVSMHGIPEPIISSKLMV